MNRERLYVGNFRGNTVDVIDVESREIIKTIDMGTSSVEGTELGMQPDSFAQSPDGSVVYTNRFPDKGEIGLIKMPGDIRAIDTSTHDALWTMPLEGQPHHIATTHDGKRLVVPIRDRNYVVVADLDSQEILGRAPCGWGPHGTEVSPDDTRLYVGTLWQDTLDVIDLDTYKNVKSISFGEGVRPFVITSDHKWAYVQLSKLHGFVVVDLEREVVTQTVHLPSLPAGVAMPTKFPYTVNHGMTMNSDESVLYVAASAGDFLAAYELPTLRLIGTTNVGKEPAYVELSSDESLLFSSNRLENTVSFVETSTMKEVERISVGEYPNRMRSISVPTTA